MVLAYHLIFTVYGIWLPNEPEDILRACRYVMENPIKVGLRAQSWSCVQPYSARMPSVDLRSTAKQLQEFT